MVLVVQGLSRDEKVKEFIQEQLLVFLMKNKDYGNSFLKSLRSYGSVAFFVRAEDKLNRLTTLLHSDKIYVATEKIEDTLRDLINYTAMYRAFETVEDVFVLDVGYQLAYFLSEDGFLEYLKEIDLIGETVDTRLLEVLKAPLDILT